MWAFAPTGEVGGMTTIAEIPANDADGTAGPWQLRQVEMPAWFISDALKRAPSTTGKFAMLEPAPT
jgi:hypothetical protein